MTEAKIIGLMERKDLEKPSRSEVLSALKEVNGHAGRAARLLKTTAHERKRKNAAADASRAKSKETDSSAGTKPLLTGAATSRTAAEYTADKQESRPRARTPRATVSISMQSPLITSVCTHRRFESRRDANSVFKGLDTKRFGWIDAASLRTALMKLGIRVSASQTEQIMCALDSVVGGAIKVEDFCDQMYAQRLEILRDTIRDSRSVGTVATLFKNYVDGVKYEVFEEVMRSDAGITKSRISDKDLVNLFEDIDEDSDGIITALDFASNLARKVIVEDAGTSIAQSQNIDDKSSRTTQPVAVDVDELGRKSIAEGDDLEKLLNTPPHDVDLEQSDGCVGGGAYCCWRRPRADSTFERVTQI